MRSLSAPLAGRFHSAVTWSYAQLSGKTRTVEVLGLVVPNPMNVVNATSAALFRQVVSDRPTLLIDEADTYLGPAAAKTA